VRGHRPREFGLTQRAHDGQLCRLALVPVGAQPSRIIAVEDDVDALDRHQRRVARVLGREIGEYLVEQRIPVVAAVQAHRAPRGIAIGSRNGCRGVKLRQRVA
jgi:hypothetical protein